jgi:transposase
MTRSPKAKLNAEGTGYERNMAAAKAGLNRSLLDAGFGQLYGMMEAKSKAFGREFAKVPPQFTSQTCNECGEVHKASRLTQSEFVCVGCGHTANADTNAARNIRDIAFPDHQERYLALAGKFKPAAACETQGQQEEAQVSPSFDKAQFFGIKVSMHPVFGNQVLKTAPR